MLLLLFKDFFAYDVKQDTYKTAEPELMITETYASAEQGEALFEMTYRVNNLRIVHKSTTYSLVTFFAELAGVMKVSMLVGTAATKFVNKKLFMSDVLG